MSHSPINNFEASAVQKYKHRWAALGRLLHSDRSFSGSERHCAFLNLNGERFADISAVTGFDFAEDGRAVLTDDWDFDGDLDVWVTARTAPRIRLLQNNSENTGGSLFLRLHGDGTTTNAEAIGARCELWLEGDERPLTRSVKAGDSFLSQSGAWLHFGLGGNEKISRVVVHWPAGKSQEFKNLQGGKRYDLRQGSSAAEEWVAPSSKSLLSLPAIPLELPIETSKARIVLPDRLLLPSLETAEGKALSDSDLKGPLLVNLWSQTCPSCRAELVEWTQHAAQFQKENLRVLLANTDEISSPESGAKAREFLAEINPPFLALSVNEATVQRFDLFQRSFLDRWLPLPVPCSFLLDSAGRVAVIYKGPVEAETLLADLTLLRADRETLRKAASPHTGIWIDGPPRIGPQSYLLQLLDYKKLGDTQRYYARYLASEELAPNASPGTIVETLKKQAFLASNLKDFSLAVSALEKAVTLAPKDAELSTLLAEAKLKASQGSKNQLEALIAKVKADPGNGQAHLALADAYRAAKNYSKAVDSYKQALRVDPKLFVAAGRLGWILATHPSPEIREPEAALAITNRLLSLHGESNVNLVDLKGIALAANGNFEEAVKSARAALALLKEESPYKQAIASRLSLYEQKKAYFEGGAE